MVTDSSATLRETPHVTETETTIISNALKRRAQSVINDTSIDPQWRAIVCYGLETNDPWLGDLVRRADAGERIIDTVDFSLEPQSNNDGISEEKIEALTEMIGMLENSAHPKLLANTAKHFAFTRCSESNLYGMVDAQVAVVEDELLAGMVLS